MHVPSSSGAELYHGRRRLTRVFLAVGLVAVLSGAASAQLEAQASLEAELQLTLDDEPGDGGRPPAPASFGPRPVAGRKPTPLSGEGDGLPLGLKNNSVVELPIFEYTVLREVREALFTGPDPEVLWQGASTVCTWSAASGCQCDWEGVSCDWVAARRLWTVTTISLDRRELGGSIPAALSELGGLEELNLAYNRLRGPLPPQLSALTGLRTLSLHNNAGLGGPLPAALGALSSLRRLDLSSNVFWGPLPAEWGNLSSISSLDLGHNQLNGTLPAAWSSLTALNTLGLDNNLLVGTLPDEWTHMVAAGGQTPQNPLELDLYDNMLLDPVPSAFGPFFHRAALNFYPQDGQIMAATPGGSGGGDGALDAALAALHASGRTSRLVAWLSALAGLLAACGTWVCGARALRRRARARAFAASCYLSPAERRYLENHYDDVLLEAAFDGRSSSTATAVSSGRSDTLLEMGLRKQGAALAAGSGLSASSSCVASSSSSIRPLAPPPPRTPRPTLQELLAVVDGGEALPPGMSPGLGRCYAAPLRGRAAVVKVLEVPGARLADSTAALLALRSAAAALEAAPAHPCLSAPVGSGVARRRGGAALYLAYEAAPRGSLADWLAPGAADSGLGLPWPTRLRHASEVAEGLAALASRRSVHGALHPGNVLLDGALHARLAHGGLLPLLLAAGDTHQPAPASIPAPPAGLAPAASLESPFLAMMAPAPPPQAAPPVPPCSSSAHTDPQYLDGSSSLTPASDVYSLGVLLLQLLTGRVDAGGLVAEVQASMGPSGATGALPPGLLDPRAGPWPAPSASALAGLALACTDRRARQRPDLRFHVLPRLAALAREGSAWMLPSKAASCASPASLRRLVAAPDGTPEVFLCPILREPMEDPVVAADGFTYERASIQRWMNECSAGGVRLASPMTNLPLSTTALTPVHALRAEIAAWREQQRQEQHQSSSKAAGKRAD